MKLLFTYYAMHTGGIETLILRFTEWLINNNNEVDILLIKKEGELLKQLNPKVKVLTLSRYPELNFLLNAYNHKYDDNYDVIYSFSPLTLWMASVIKAKICKKSILLNGIYHLYDFKLFGDKYNCSLFTNILADESKIFMNPNTRIEHEFFFKRNFENSYIWPLAINLPKLDLTKRVAKKFKIVSVGRLADFKTYNIYMLDIMNRLKAEDINAEYHIYGTGVLKNEITKKINDLNLSNYVFLHSTVDYRMFFNVISDAYVFIGMGTSVLEAALYGVPSIVAIAYSENSTTHGFVHELPDFNCGEPINNYELKSVYTLLLKLFTLNEEDYSKLSSISRTTIQKQYDIDILMNSLFEYLEKNKEKLTLLKNIKWPIMYVINKLLIHLMKQIKVKLKQVLTIS